MTAAAQAPASTTPPDPPRADSDMPPRISRVLGLVHKLIDYGKQLAATVQERAAAPGFACFARPFGSTDLAVILSRIANGLRLAAALEARLCRRAARGQDLRSSPTPPLTGGGARAGRQAAAPVPRIGPAQDPRLAHLTTDKEIAAAVRCRPVGAVIADICGDFAIAPGQLDRAFWDEIRHAITMYGGSLVRFLGNLHQRLSAFRAGNHADPSEPEWSPALQRLPAPVTGPP